MTPARDESSREPAMCNRSSRAAPALANSLSLVLGLAATLGFASASRAQALPASRAMPAATAEVPHRDPWVPESVRRQAAVAAAPAPTRGAALQAQVERKLKANFEAADLSRSGKLTRQQAAGAGLGWVDIHFDEIDRDRKGAVSFDDVKRYMNERAEKSR